MSSSDSHRCATKHTCSEVGHTRLTCGGDTHMTHCATQPITRASRLLDMPPGKIAASSALDWECCTQGMLLHWRLHDARFYSLAHGLGMWWSDTPSARARYLCTRALCSRSHCRHGASPREERCLFCACREEAQATCSREQQGRNSGLLCHTRVRKSHARALPLCRRLHCTA